MPMTSKNTAQTGRELVAAILADVEAEGLELDAREVDLLQRAGRAADVVASLETMLSKCGRTFTDKDGVVRPSPLLAEIRQQTVIIARCLGGIALDQGRTADPAKSRAGRASWAARSASGDCRGAIPRSVG